MLLTVAIFVMMGCTKKSSDSVSPSVDNVAKVIGIYSGTTTYGSYKERDTFTITKQTSSTVLMMLTDTTQTSVNYAGVTVSDGGNGTVLLTLGTDISGVVNGKQLDCYIQGNFHFIGYKP
jgi:hypothetical protein